MTYRFNQPKALLLDYGGPRDLPRPVPLSSLAGGQEGFGVVPFDYDNDGDLDLYVCSLHYASLLHRNNGHGDFEQVAEQVGLHHRSGALAAFPADYDNDGDLDLFVAQSGEEANLLCRNEGGAQFTEVASAAGVDAVAITTGAAWADFDNDGDLHLLLSSVGHPYLYDNQGDGHFRDATQQAFDAALLGAQPATAGVAAADYDGDGDVDVFLAGIDGPGLLLRNDSTSQGHWLRVELQGRRGQQGTLGARVHVRAGGQELIREHVVTSLLGSTHGDLLHFGLGAASAADAVTVDWPSGARQVLAQVPAD